MQIQFDHTKREKTLAERGLDFARAGEVFAGLHFTGQDVRQDYAEDRFITVGCWMRAWWSWSGHRAARCAASSA